MKHLAELAGAAPVQAMISEGNDCLFFGDMRQFTPHSCSFSEFLSSADGMGGSATAQSTPDSATDLNMCQAYLAQASLDSGHPLEPLRTDFELPKLISHADVSHTNLWMSIRYLHLLVASDYIAPTC